MVLILAAVFYCIPDKIAMIFSSDPEVIELYTHVALPLTTMLIAMNLSVLLERVPLSCGRTQVVLWTGVVGSWVAQVPAVLLCTKYYKNDLYGLFTGVTIGYCALDVLLLGVVYTTDWAYFAQDASRRSEAVIVSEEEDNGDQDKLEDMKAAPKTTTTTPTTTISNDTTSTATVSTTVAKTVAKYTNSYNCSDETSNTEEEASLW
jgi:hypothetical protein